MSDQLAAPARPAVPTLGATIELLKPITWFAPMWAFGCGVVSSNASVGDRWLYVVGGILLAGPLVCGTSQAVNDWFDREVDAINEPNRVIPSGRMPGRWGLFVALANTVISLAVAWWLGAWVFGAAMVGLILAWVYSAPPVRLKRSGWYGPGAVGLCYEGLPWFTAAAAASGGFPGFPTLLVALLYSAGAHGIMTLNDFKSVEGDRQTGLASLPAVLGVDRAARLACFIMGVPQLVVIALLFAWGFPLHALIVARTAVRPGGVHAAHDDRSPATGILVQRNGYDNVCLWHAGSCLRHPRHAGSVSMPMRSLGWLGIFRLGLVQAALGSIVVLTTSTLNRIMVVELSLAALVPGALVGLHYGVQIARPLWGHGSDKGGRRTPWIIGGVGLLALGGFGASVAVAVMASHFTLGLALAVVDFLLIGVGVGAAGTSLLALLASSVAEQRRPAAATLVWLMMIFGIAVTAVVSGKFLDPFSMQRLSR